MSEPEGFKHGIDFATKKPCDGKVYQTKHDPTLGECGCNWWRLELKDFHEGEK